MDKSAFGGKFPWQVRFELWHNDLKPVSLEVGEANEYLIQRLPYLKERYRNGKLHNPNGNKVRGGLGAGNECVQLNNRDIALKLRSNKLPCTRFASRPSSCLSLASP